MTNQLVFDDHPKPYFSWQLALFEFLPIETSFHKKKS